MAVPQAGNTGTTPAHIQLTFQQADTGNELTNIYIYTHISDNVECFEENKRWCYRAPQRLKSLLMKVKEESERVGLKLNI